MMNRFAAIMAKYRKKKRKIIQNKPENVIRKSNSSYTTTQKRDATKFTIKSANIIEKKRSQTNTTKNESEQSDTDNIPKGRRIARKKPQSPWLSRKRKKKKQLEKVAKEAQNPHFPIPTHRVLTRRSAFVLACQTPAIPSQSQSHSHHHHKKQHFTGTCTSTESFSTDKKDTNGPRNYLTSRFTPYWSQSISTNIAPAVTEKEFSNSFQIEDDDEGDLPPNKMQMSLLQQQKSMGQSNNSVIGRSLFMQREKALTDANQMELTGKEQMIMKRCAFGNVEVAIEEAELERKIKEISAKKSNQQHKEQREMPADEIYMDTCLFSLESCRPQFELIAEELGLGLREQCDSLVFFSRDGPASRNGCLLCFSDSTDGQSICVDEFRHSKLSETIEWVKSGQQQFLDTVLGRCVRFFAAAAANDNNNERAK